jgi:uncharacterized 2Fe-2S/4Fe-4S cluster protein (DUF4445 family)
MPQNVQIELLPLGTTLSVPRSTPLQDVLFAQGVEFPCGGRGRCKGCRVKVLEGSLDVSSEDQRLLSPAELADGWRLACRARPETDLKIELAQWEAAILTDDAPFVFTPRDGLGVAVDLGTTTIVAQLLDLRTANVLAVQTALNVQARHGADIMSRIDFALAGGEATLREGVRVQIGSMIEAFFAGRRHQPSELRDVVVVGNTVMHHLFCGIPVKPLSHYPFEPERDGLQGFSAEKLGWGRPESGQARGLAGAAVHFLPCLGGFVGSDILAGVLATNLQESGALVGLIDLGTNGEMVFGHGRRLLCASTAAGPAFEGARISMGMRAATGAISEVAFQDGQLRSRVLGNGPPRGICGSGLVDAVAVGLDTGMIEASGRLRDGRSFVLTPPVELNQKDIRELQLAKGAIAAGVRILLRMLAAAPEGVSRIHLAGAFGNYINRVSARRIGLLPFPLDKVDPAGNTALRGAKLALFAIGKQDLAFPHLRNAITHVPLHADEQFEEVFVDEMGFSR